MIREESSHLGMEEPTSLNRTKINQELEAALTDIKREQQFALLEQDKELEAALTDIRREQQFALLEQYKITGQVFAVAIGTCSFSIPICVANVNEIASPLSDRSHYYEPSFTTTEIRNLILERIAFFEKDQRLTAREKGPMHQRANETDTSRQNDFSKRPTASIKDGVMLLQDEIRGNNQIPEANRIAKQKICIEETAGRMIDVVNDLADEIRRKGMIGIENIQLELDIIRKSTANLKGTVKALIEEIRQEHHIVDDGDIAEELGYILWLIAELMGALKRLRTAMRQNQLYLKPVGIKRKPNIVVIKREVSGDDALQRLKKTKHIVTYDLAGEKRPTYGNLSAVLCELCINENEAVNWCETCNSNICVSCTCFHKDVRMMMNHRIFNLP